MKSVMIWAVGFAALMMSASAVAQTAAPKEAATTNPDWLKKPTFDQMLATYPAAAKGADGSATIKCAVTTDGLLRACTVVRETPAGKGFGPAAILLSSSFLMKPATKDGQPVEGVVSIPVNWKGFGSYASPTGPAIHVMNSTAWAKTPTMPDILAELDKKVGDKFADGKVVFQCTVSKKTGKLSNCIILNTSASMVGFTSAAKSLTSKFEANTQGFEKVKEEVRVNLTFAFPDMQSEAWSRRYLTHPVWLQTISPDPNQAPYPEEAVKAGLKQGSATVDCVLSSTGALTHCATVSESTPGVGFGELAQKIAEVFVANPWTEDGLPADGAHVRFPITMKYNPSQAPPPASPAKP